MIGSISQGTHRNEDLIPAFIDALNDVLGEDAHNHAQSTREKIQDIESRMEQDKYFDSPEAWYDCEELIDLLDLYAPPFCYFGTRPGDGADFGYWVDIEYVRRAIQDGELPSGDEIPDGPTETGYFLQISDHGNMELYEYDDGKWTSIWSVV